MKFNRTIAAMTCAGAVALALVSAMPASAQQQPSAAALASAREIVEIKGAATIFKPVIAGVVERVKLSFLQTNPNLQRDLDAVAGTLHTELTARQKDIDNSLSRLYAQRFTEAELKDILVFYKSPLGRKLSEEDPKFVDDSMRYMDDWSAKLAEEVIGKFRVEMKKKGHDI